jgi:hypothetical protein
MVNIIHLFAIILAGVSVGIADALIKKSAVAGSFWSAVKSPLMLAILGLYIAQILFFVYVFKNNWNLGIVGNLQMIFYSFTVIVSGLLFFGETISLVQGIGIGLAIMALFL